MKLKTQSFRDIVAKELERRQLTIYEIAPQMGLERRTLYRWLKGEQALTDTKLEVVLAFLDLKVVCK